MMKKIIPFLAALIFALPAQAQRALVSGGGGGGGTAPPLMSGVGASGITSTGATINWNTSPAGDSQVCYATTANPYPGGTCTTVTNTSPTVTTHAVNLTGLTTGTPYHYQAVSNQAGTGYTMKTVSADATFTPVSSYQGPGDLSINSSILAHGAFRCYSSTYTGNVASITDTNASPTTFTLSCTTGGVLTATNGGSGNLLTLKNDCVSSNSFCTVSTWRDQSGKTSCTGAACDLTCVGTCKVISNCPSFTVTYAFCYVAVPTATGRLVSSNTFNPTTTIPFSIVALEYPQSNTSSGDDPFWQLTNQILNLDTTRYRYTNGTANNLLINVAPSGWQVVCVADNNSASATSYMILNNGTNQVSGVMGVNSFGGSSIYLMTGVNTIYIEEWGMWSADIHTSCTNYYTQVSGYLGGF